MGQTALILSAISVLLVPEAIASTISSLSVTLRGAGGGPYRIDDNGADGRDKNPAPNVIQFDDPGAHFDFQQGFFGVGGRLPTLTAIAAANSLEVILTDLAWSNFANPTVLSSIEFNLTWNNPGGPGTFAEFAVGSWRLPSISENAPTPLPSPSPVRGTVSQAGEGGGVTLFDDQSEANAATDAKNVALQLADGPKDAVWTVAASVFGNVQFNVVNVVPYTEGTHTVEIPGSAHWRATVVPEPSSFLLSLLGLALISGVARVRTSEAVTPDVGGVRRKRIIQTRDSEV